MPRRIENKIEIQNDIALITIYRISGEAFTFIVDVDKVSIVSSYQWRVHINRPGGNIYATSASNGKEIMMHRLLTNATPTLVVDHINGNTLDNRSSNLRLVTSGINSQNRK